MNNEKLSFDIKLKKKHYWKWVLTISEVSTRSKFGKSKTRHILNELVANGYSKVVGSGRGTKYRA